MLPFLVDQKEGIHIPLGDTRQLPAYQMTKEPLKTALKNTIDVMPFFLLEVQHRQPANLSAIPSLFFYEGKINSIGSPSEKLPQTFDASSGLLPSHFLMSCDVAAS